LPEILPPDNRKRAAAWKSLVICEKKLKNLSRIITHRGCLKERLFVEDAGKRKENRWEEPVKKGENHRLSDAIEKTKGKKEKKKKKKETKPKKKKKKEKKR